eukprot:6450918-Prymnesium_polylepis.1
MDWSAGRSQAPRAARGLGRVAVGRHCGRARVGARVGRCMAYSHDPTVGLPMRGATDACMDGPTRSCPPWIQRWTGPW